MDFKNHSIYFSKLNYNDNYHFDKLYGNYSFFLYEDDVVIPVWIWNIFFGIAGVLVFLCMTCFLLWRFQTSTGERYLIRYSTLNNKKNNFDLL